MQVSIRVIIGTLMFIASAPGWASVFSSSSHRKACEAIWHTLPECADETINPFREGGMAEHLQHELLVNGSIAKVSASTLKSFRIAVSNEQDDSLLANLTCSYPIAWKVDMVQVDVDYDALFLADERSRGTRARSGVLMTGRVWGSRHDVFHRRLPRRRSGTRAASFVSIRYA